jgi:hypothetical protein
VIIVIAILVALVLSWLSASIWLKIHGKAVEKATSTCTECGGKTIVKPDPHNSQLVVTCQNENCACISSRPVRASALSLFGVTQLSLTFLAGTLSYMIVDAMEYRLPFKVFVTLLGIMLGAVVIRFFIRAIVFTLLQSKLPVAWQEEMVAYLAPPPFLKQERENPNK